MRDYLLAVFSLILVVIALFITGGPQRAAALNRDEIRISDIQALAYYDFCEARDADLCGVPPRDSDPYTNQPYLRTAAGWCANLEVPDVPRVDIINECFAGMQF